MFGTENRGQEQRQGTGTGTWDRNLEQELGTGTEHIFIAGSITT